MELSCKGVYEELNCLRSTQTKTTILQLAIYLMYNGKIYHNAHRTKPFVLISDSMYQNIVTEVSNYIIQTSLLQIVQDDLKTHDVDVDVSSV